MRTNILRWGIALVLVAPLPTSDIPTHCLLPTPPKVMAQEGNEGHREPPPGWVCSQGKDVPPDHACSCHRECKDQDKLDENGEGTGQKETVMREDPKCKVFCYAKHCMCPVHNCE